MSQKSLPQQSSLNFFSCLLVLDFFLLIDAIFIVSIRKKKVLVLSPVVPMQKKIE